MHASSAEEGARLASCTLSKLLRTLLTVLAQVAVRNCLAFSTATLFFFNFYLRKFKASFASFLHDQHLKELYFRKRIVSRPKFGHIQGDKLLHEKNRFSSKTKSF